jgi:FtsH-binding integral membrane protein
VYEQSSPYAAAPTAQAISTTRLMGQVMFLVAVALGITALGTVVGKNLSYGTAFIVFLGGFGMLMVQSFGGRRFRVGSFAIGWLGGIALAIGIGIAPTINQYSQVDPAAVTEAAAGTALTVLATASIGFFLSKDLAPWMRPLSLTVFVLAAVSIGALVFGGIGGGLSPFLSLAIFGISALLIVVDFNFLRKHGTEDDTVWLATGIFVSIINIFLSLLNIFSR